MSSNKVKPANASEQSLMNAFILIRRAWLMCLRQQAKRTGGCGCLMQPGNTIRNTPIMKMALQILRAIGTRP